LIGRFEIHITQNQYNYSQIHTGNNMATISVGELMIEKLETIDSYSTALEAAKKKVR